MAMGESRAPVRLRLTQHAAANGQFDRIVDALAGKLPAVAEHLQTARAEILAFASFPNQVGRKIWSKNPNERLTPEIRRRTGAVGIFPDVPPSSGSSAPCWPNNTTNGPAATSALNRPGIDGGHDLTRRKGSCLHRRSTTRRLRPGQ